jgi:hypothetical protein
MLFPVCSFLFDIFPLYLLMFLHIYWLTYSLPEIEGRSNGDEKGGRNPRGFDGKIYSISLVSLQQ